MEELLGSRDTCFLKAGCEPGSGFKRLRLNKGVAMVANSTPTECETTSPRSAVQVEAWREKPARNLLGKDTVRLSDGEKFLIALLRHN